MCARSGEHLQCVVTPVFFSYVYILFCLPLWWINMINYAVCSSQLFETLLWTRKRERPPQTGRKWNCGKAATRKSQQNWSGGGGGPTDFFRWDMARERVYRWSNFLGIFGKISIDNFRRVRGENVPSVFVRRYRLGVINTHKDTHRQTAFDRLYY